jgi:O-succinylhomoserine sulfhydrylase
MLSARRCPVLPMREHSVPLYMTSSFVFDDAEQARALFADEIPGNIYTRFSNPNTTEFIEKMCLLEGAEDGIATASGMSAVFTSFASLLKSGDHLLVSRSVFGSTHQILTMILPKWGITHTYADIDKPETWEALDPKEHEDDLHRNAFESRAGYHRSFVDRCDGEEA